MSYPIIVTLEMSHADEGSFPVAAAWSLPDGRLKSTLIRPEETWLDDSDACCTTHDPDELFQFGHSAKSVLEELQLDREDEPLYCVDYEQTQNAFDQLYDAVDGVNDLPLRPVSELLIDSDPLTLSAQLDEIRLTLDLDPFSAEGITRQWLEVVAHCFDGEI